MAKRANFADIHTDPVPVNTILPGLDEAWQSADTDTDRTLLRRQVADYARIALFACEIGVPFCVEANPSYRTPHAVLHEIGHWAVKPDPYIQVYRVLSKRDFTISQSDIVIDERFGESRIISGLTYYPGHNDRMPDWDLLDEMDPTPNEKSVRAWTRHAIGRLALTDPISATRSKSYQTQGVGDSSVAKGSSYRTWSAMAVHSEQAQDEFAAFSFNPASGLYRPSVNSLELPYLQPATLAELAG